jgi:hypothetical protein
MTQMAPRATCVRSSAQSTVGIGSSTVLLWERILRICVESVDFAQPTAVAGFGERGR